MSGPKVLVFGDVMLDIYVSGTVKRDSPEAPGAPVISHDRMATFPGGAANVAANVASLGGEAMALGVVGRDPAATMLEETLAEGGGVNLDFLVRDEAPTTTKTRFVADGRQLMRLDMEHVEPLSAEDETELMEQIAKLAPQANAIVVSDYAKGAVTPSIAAGLVRLGVLNGVPVVVDAKEPAAKQYWGATVIKPNRTEIARALRCSSPAVRAHPVVCARKLWRMCKCGAVLLTCGENGMVLVGDDGATAIAGHTVKEVDVTGAGDTVAAALAVALASGAGIVEAAHFANAAAAVAVTRAGTARPTLEEVGFFFDRDSGRDRAARRPLAGQPMEGRFH